MDIHVTKWGDGPAVMFVHGSVMSGEDTWVEQRPLAERWSMHVVDRRGYFPNHPPRTRTSKSTLGTSPSC
jgi:pimeloyl-ACP methyl ester carboxylesterase